MIKLIKKFFHHFTTSKSEEYRVVMLFAEYSNKKLKESIEKSE